MPHVAAVVNPRAGNGRTGRAWRIIGAALTRELGPIQTHFTSEPATSQSLPAAELARKALHQNAQMIIAVGGKGTINEVINGFFEDGRLINRETHLAIVNTGSGGSIDQEDAIARLAGGVTRSLYIGRCSFTAKDGGEQIRYFVREARLGRKAGLLLRIFRRTPVFRLALDEARKIDAIEARLTPEEYDFSGLAVQRGGSRMEFRTGAFTAIPLRVRAASLYLDDVEVGMLPAGFEPISEMITLRG